MIATSEYMFGVTRNITKREGKRRDKIARQFDGNFVGPIDLPGIGKQGWFVISNCGEPFNSNEAKEILQACGL